MVPRDAASALDGRDGASKAAPLRPIRRDAWTHLHCSTENSKAKEDGTTVPLKLLHSEP